MRQAILLCGDGGQGLVLAGAILTEAAGTYEGKEVVQTQSHGIQARGGASQSCVIISDQPIKFPITNQFDIMLCLSQQAYERYSTQLTTKGMLMIDRDLVCPVSSQVSIQRIDLPFTSLAEQLDRRILANIIALGALVKISGVVKCTSIAGALTNWINEKHQPLAQEVLSIGFELGISVATQL